MNPTKCPNCRLSLPQNWSGANDPNAKCPYCGKSITASPAAPAAPAPAPQPAPAPKAAAKTMLWGAGMSLPLRPPAPPAAPQQPMPPAAAPPAAPLPPEPAAKPAPPSAPDGMGDARTLSRNAVSEPAGVGRTGTAQSIPPALDSGPRNVEVAEAPAPNLGADRPSRPAPTVMYDSAVQMNPSVASYGRPDADVAPSIAPAVEPEPPADPSPPPALTRGKVKGKPAPRKIYKPKSGLTKQRDDGDDDDDDLTKKPPSSKLGLIIFLSLVAVGLLVVGIIVLRGKGKTEAVSPEDTTQKAKPTPEPAPAEEPPALAPAEPPRPAPAEPEPAARPAKAAVEKPAPVERPARAERPRPEPSPAAEPKAAARSNEEDARRASEAYQRGNAKLIAGNAKEAIAEFSQALRLNPKDPASHRALGLAYEQAGNTNEAVKQLKLYLRAAPKAGDRAMVEKKLEQLRSR